MRRRLLLVPAVILALGAGAYVVRPRRPAATDTAPAASARPGVAVLGFASRCDSNASRWVAVALAERLRSELAARPGLRVASGDSVARLRADLGIPEAERFDAASLSRIRAHLGTDMVLSGASDCSADGAVHLTVVAQDAASGAVRLELKETAYESRLGTVARAVAAEVSQLMLGTASASVGPSAAEAGADGERLLAEGLARLRAFDAQGARGYLERAVAVAPSNGATHAALGQAWSMLGYQSRAAEAASRAVQNSGSLSAEDRLVVQARHLEVSGRHADAAATWLTLAEQFPDDIEHPLRLARAYVAAGQGKQALQAVQRGRGIAQAAEDARLDLEEARALDLLGRFDEAQQAVERAIAAGEKRGARLMVAEARMVKAETLRKRGQTAEAAEICADAARQFGAAGDRAARARALSALATNLWYRGDLAGAHRAAEEAVGVSRQLGDNSGILRALNTLAGLASDEGRLDAARRQYEQALAIATEVGERDREVMAVTNIGIALWKQGDLPRARKALDEALGQARAFGNERRTAFALLSLSEVAVDGGEPEKGRVLAEEALDIGQRLRVAGIQADARYALGRAALARGDTAAARGNFDESIRSARERNLGNYLAQWVTALGRVELAEGRPAEAAAHAAEAAASFRAQKATPYEGSAELVRAAAFRALGRFDDARRHLAEAERLLAVSEYAAFRVMLATEKGALADATGDPGAARAHLQRAVLQARRAGLLTLQTTAELALAQTTRGEARLKALAAVEQQSSRAGLDGLARQARSLLAPAGGATAAAR